MHGNLLVPEDFVIPSCEEEDPEHQWAWSDYDWRGRNNNHRPLQKLAYSQPLHGFALGAELKRNMSNEAKGILFDLSIELDTTASLQLRTELEAVKTKLATAEAAGTASAARVVELEATVEAGKSKARTISVERRT